MNLRIPVFDRVARVLLFLGVIMGFEFVSVMGSLGAERKAPYKGFQVQGIGTLLCKSDQLAAGGFWRDIGSGAVEEGASYGKESKITTWRITIRENAADVIRFSGASQTIEEPELFSVEGTSGGLLLISRSRRSGESPQIITIDPSNGSFVYSSQHVNPFWNRANIFYGTCRPYP